MWRIAAPEIAFQGAGGSWSTPALYGNYVVLHDGRRTRAEVDRVTGRAAWELQIGSPAIGSPVVIDGTLIQGDCSGRLYAWDVTDPHGCRRFGGRWTSATASSRRRPCGAGGSTSGTREGYFYGLSDEGTPAPA